METEQPNNITPFVRNRTIQLRQGEVPPSAERMNAPRPDEVELNNLAARYRFDLSFIGPQIVIEPVRRVISRVKARDHNDPYDRLDQQTIQKFSDIMVKRHQEGISNDPAKDYRIVAAQLLKDFREIRKQDQGGRLPVQTHLTQVSLGILETALMQNEYLLGKPIDPDWKDTVFTAVQGSDEETFELAVDQLVTNPIFFSSSPQSPTS